MGLLDGYFDPEQFQASGGLLGRLVSLPPMQGLYQRGVDFDPQVSADNRQPARALMPVPLPMPRPILQANGPAASPQTAFYRPTPDIPFRGYPMPQSGSADVSQAVQQPSNPGDRRSAGYQSWTHAPNGNPVAGLANGITGLSSGRRSEAGDRAGGSGEANSIAGEQPPGLSKIGYFEIPTNPNQAIGELLGIQERNEGNTISQKDHVSGVREGNIRRKEDGSLEVTNGTVVTFSCKDGRAKTITVTGEDIADIDINTGEVAIQKSF
ncbi:hypothetical protein [Bradyrhizobium sp.]|uniref:hypothetical protein n=1 Tax=Bradyrhizobium sp. TaxID=376 RepID=UPI0027360906|nr:hypothetical protein [Bradyrhizobium sp.]MDP3076652.1 hypothetical protein [Bradyrhizobium sp.]